MQSVKLVLSTNELREALGGISNSTLRKLRKLGLFKPLAGIRHGQKYPTKQLEDYLNGGK